MPKCARCNESAPSNPPCPHGLCGKCCDGAPPCDVSIHKKPRRKVRGVVGAGAHARKVAAWKEAHRRCRHLWRTGREKTLSRVLGVTPVAMRMATMKVILAEARAQLGLDDAQGASAQASDTPMDMAVAMLVPPKTEAEAVRSVMACADLHEFLQEGIDVEDPPSPLWPDWGDDADEGGWSPSLAPRMT